MTSKLSLYRRILGEKSTNASLNIQEHSHGIKGERQALDAAKRTQTASPQRAGTKRRFQDLELSSQEEFQDGNMWHQGALAKAGPEYTSEIVKPEDDDSNALTSFMIESNSTNTSSRSLNASTNTVLTSFFSSQEPSQPIEEQFEIVQEESQRTLEQIHATIIPEPKLSLLPPERPSLSTELSQDSVRMSSFIDFDEPDQSQKEKINEDMEMIIPLETMPSNEEELKAKQLLQKATILRTRLQLAMHKVRTNQSSKPFSRLDKPTTTSPKLSLSPRPFTANVLPPKTDSTSIRNSPESQIAANRARACRGAYQCNPVQRLSALPIPKIVPTAYSARYMTQPQSQQRDSRSPATDIPSSPPASDERTPGVKTLKIRNSRATPSPRKLAGTKTRVPKTPMHQLSSPPGSDDGVITITGRKTHGTSRSALTSSVVKGEAANGLLELMRAASR